MRTGELLEVEVVVADGQAEIIVGGELDLVTGPILERHVRACAEGETVRALTLDLRAVSFCDGAGLRALARSRRCAAGHRLRYRALPSGPVERIVAIAGDAADRDALP